MGFLYLPLFTGDYIKKTRGLSPAQHGVYLLLLMHQWDTNDGIPIDEDECAAICNCRHELEYAALRSVLARYFPVANGKRYNPRLQEEIKRSEWIIKARSKAGKASGIARAKQHEQMLNTCSTDAEQMSVGLGLGLGLGLGKEVPSPVGGRGVGKEPLPKRNGATAPRATRLPRNWALPDDWKQWAVEAYNVAPQEAVRMSLTFRDYWLAKSGQNATKVDWLATWRNWCRRELEGK